ncbi:MAG: DUF1116 domain-containing protein [Lacrimispora sp.]|uniref:DUF1116 domain-containing protein n=1 Tax=Lacrimispora sp. TaxID=2719234 RepID=UPI0039E34EA1
MSKINNLLKNKPKSINMGLEGFQEDLEKQNQEAVQMNWKPPVELSPEVAEALSKLMNRPDIDEANQKAAQIIIDAHPVLIGYDTAINVVPGMTKDTILHAGPPITWDRMNGAMRGAIAGGIIFEGFAKDYEEACEVAASGKVKFSPCHEHGCVGSMAGVTTASMPVHIIKNKTHGNLAFTNLSEQMPKVLRMGANDQSVMDRLQWMKDVLGEVLKEAMKLAGEIDLRAMLAGALHMGDECHNRNTAATSLFIQTIAPYIVETSFSDKVKKEVFDFMNLGDYFTGPTWMGYCKCALDAAHNIENSTVVTTMCRNGTDFGIRVSGIGGNIWFTGPAQRVVGIMFPGYKHEDAGNDIGDSAITETYGIGAFAMAAAPAIVQITGGTVSSAIDYTVQMTEITTAENHHLTIPNLDFRGTATAIDVRKVLETGILPIINTAMAHKEPGIGMIGAGLTHPPMDCFEKAAAALAEKLEK